MSVDHPEKTPLTFPSVASIAAGFFDVYAEEDQRSPNLSFILLVAPYDKASRSLGRIIEELHAVCMIVPAWALSKCCLNKFGKSLSCIVIDELSHARNLSASLAGMINDIAPNIPLILLASRGEALGTPLPKGVEAILPKPVDRTAAKLGIISATINKAQSLQAKRNGHKAMLPLASSRSASVREGE